MNNFPAMTEERLEQLATRAAWTCFQDAEVAAMARELLALRNAREGWKLVPVEPSPEQRLASKRYKASTKITTGPGFYRAMVAAAPEVGNE